MVGKISFLKIPGDLENHDSRIFTYCSIKFNVIAKKRILIVFDGLLIVRYIKISTKDVKGFSPGIFLIDQASILFFLW